MWLKIREISENEVEIEVSEGDEERMLLPVRTNQRPLSSRNGFGLWFG